ncbi:hypothetical protein HOY80DRAFT_1039835 [Tuber brumale]|nr:hypothetical protein HOY80DRAFT_1039835 [Tuber brumale]
MSIRSKQEEQEGNLFANDDATDIDENNDEAPQHHRRVQKRSVEDYSQHQQRAKRLRFLTAESPSPALTGPTSALSSQTQQAQIHSGHRRGNSPHFTPSILVSQPILTHQNGCQTAEEDNSVSNIVDTVTSLSDQSNFIRGEERIVFENAANMVKAASKLGLPGLTMQKHAMTFLKSRQSSTSSHLVSETRITMQDFYDLLHKQPAEMRAKVCYLLEDDHFTCHPSKQENCGFQFGAPEIAKLLYHKATWQRLPVVVQKKLVEDTKKRIKRLLRDNGFVQEHESRAALEDPDAAEYLRVQVSGDEESEVEDNNSDPEVEDVIDALVEGPEEDE